MAFRGSHQPGSYGGPQGRLQGGGGFSGPDFEMIQKIGSGINNRLHNMKASYKMFQDFLKLAMNYAQAQATAAGCGRQMAAVLKKVSTGQGQPDIAQGFRAMAEMQHAAETRKDSVLKAFHEELFASAQNVLTGGFKETCRFEQGFNMGFDRARGEVAQFPMGSRERMLKVREVEDKLANNLVILQGLERKVYTNFLLLWTAVLDAQTADFKASAEAFGRAQMNWTQLAVSGDRIAPEPVDYKQVLAERRGEPYHGPGAMHQQQQQQQAQQQLQMRQMQMQMQMGANWGKSAPIMNAASILPQGVPALPGNMHGAREQLQQQYKQIPKFDDLDESGLDAWELPDIGANLGGPGRQSSSGPNRQSSMGSSAGGSFGSRGGASPPVQRTSSLGGVGSVPMDCECLAKALYAYKANNDDEHTFGAGQVFEIVSFDSDNWWTGRKRGERVQMLVPANYVEKM